MQEPIQFSDGSLLKLTIARYYSPSGRCLQKPYTKGDTENYQNDIYSRYLNGEFTSQDSIHLSGKEYYTRLGRTVFGGGGVMPDVFIPADTSDVTSYYMEAVSSKRVAEFAYHYADNNREELGQFEDWKELADHLRKQNLVDKFATYAERNGLRRRNVLIKKSYKRLNTVLTATVIDYILDDKSSSLYLNQTDPNISRALYIIDHNKTFPQQPETKRETRAKQKK